MIYNPHGKNRVEFFFAGKLGNTPHCSNSLLFRFCNGMKLSVLIELNRTALNDSFETAFTVITEKY